MIPTPVLWATLVAVMSPQEQDPPKIPDFRSVHLALAEEHTASFVSGFGHVFVCLSDKEVDSVEDLMGSVVVNFGADIGPLGDGATIGRYRLQPCHELIRKNTYFDQRSITFFELDLDPRRIAVLRDDLTQRMRLPYTYEFLRKSCAYHMWDWLDGTARSPRPRIYMTPREAVERILEIHPAKAVRVLPSRVQVLEAYLERNPSYLVREVRRGLEDPRSLEDIGNPVLRMLTLDVAESRATREEFVALQGVRARTLRGPDGATIAGELVRFREELAVASEDSWQEEAEGPAISAGFVDYGGKPGPGVRLQAELGMRDFHTAPSHENVLREVSFLDVALDLTDEDVRGDVELVSISMTRDLHSFNRGTSNGAALGYAGLPDASGRSGAYFSAWLGLDDQTPVGWLGGRITLLADELQDRGDLRAMPGVSWTYPGRRLALRVEAHYDVDVGTGWLVEQDLLLTDALTLNASWVHTPHGEDVVAVVLQKRF